MLGYHFEKQSMQRTFIQFFGDEVFFWLHQTYWPDRTARKVGIGQTKQTKIWALVRPIRPKSMYWPDQTDQKVPLARQRGRLNFCCRPLSTELGRTPCPRSRSVWPIPFLDRRPHPGWSYCGTKNVQTLDPYFLQEGLIRGQSMENLNSNGVIQYIIYLLRLFSLLPPPPPRRTCYFFFYIVRCCITTYNL